MPRNSKCKAVCGQYHSKRSGTAVSRSCVSKLKQHFSFMPSVRTRSNVQCVTWKIRMMRKLNCYVVYSDADPHFASSIHTLLLILKQSRTNYERQTDCSEHATRRTFDLYGDRVQPLVIAGEYRRRPVSACVYTRRCSVVSQSLYNSLYYLQWLLGCVSRIIKHNQGLLTTLRLTMPAHASMYT